MKTIIIAAVMLGACASPLCAQSNLPPQADRTASWYARNPAVLARVTAACRNDPGHGRTNPDCINADQARILVGVVEAQRGAGTLTPTSNPKFWRDHPDTQQTVLAYCSHMTNPVDRANFHCNEAAR